MRGNAASKKHCHGLLSPVLVSTGSESETALKSRLLEVAAVVGRESMSLKVWDRWWLVAGRRRICPLASSCDNPLCDIDLFTSLFGTDVVLVDGRGVNVAGSP